jgi:hypothetical protein
MPNAEGVFVVRFIVGVTFRRRSRLVSTSLAWLTDQVTSAHWSKRRILFFTVSMGFLS